MVRSVKVWAAAAALSVIVVASAWAADAGGKWKWSQMRGQNTVEMVLELKLDGEKLTGNVTAGDMKTEIKEGTVKDGNVSFVVEREINGMTRKTTYKGKVDGDSIKGTTTNVRNGQEQSREWAASRVK